MACHTFGEGAYQDTDTDIKEYQCDRWKRSLIPKSQANFTPVSHANPQKSGPVARMQHRCSQNRSCPAAKPVPRMSNCKGLAVAKRVRATCGQQPNGFGC